MAKDTTLQFIRAGDFCALLYTAEKPDTAACFVCLLCGEGESRAVWEQLPATTALLAIETGAGGLDWNRDLSPWPAEAAFKGTSGFEGAADLCLARLTGQLLPAAWAALGFRPRQHLLAGYSLAGLFSLYALYRTDIFCAAACASTSLWYDDFEEFVRSHRFADCGTPLPKCVFFSLGDLEKNARNPRLARVERCTQTIQQLLAQQGVATDFTLNAGGHFFQPERRTAQLIEKTLAFLEQPPALPCPDCK